MSSSSSSSSLPVEIFARVFPFLGDDLTSWYHLAQCNKELHKISQALGGPYKWPETLIDWETTEKEYYVQQVKYSHPLTTTTTCSNYNYGRHMALLLRIYENSEATDYHQVVRMLDISTINESNTHSHDGQTIPDLPVGKSTIFTSFGAGNSYFVAVEPWKVRVFGLEEQHQQYLLMQEMPSFDRIVGIQVYDTSHPKIALQTEEQDQGDGEPYHTLTVWSLLQGEFIREIPYTGSANFCITEDDRVFACMDGGEDGRSVTTVFFDNNPNARNMHMNNTHDGDREDVARTYILNLPGTARRSWIDTCKFSPDGHRLAVLTEDCIFQLDTSVEPPQWIPGHGVAPDGCTFSGQLQYSPDSQSLLAHARTPWDNVYYDDRQNLNTIQIWDVSSLSTMMTLRATKGFHDLVGSVGLSLDGKFVVVIQGDESDVFRSAINRVVTRYVAAMEDYSPYPESGD